MAINHALHSTLGPSVAAYREAQQGNPYRSEYRPPLFGGFLSTFYENDVCRQSHPSRTHGGKPQFGNSVFAASDGWAQPAWAKSSAMKMLDITI